MPSATKHRRNHRAPSRHAPSPRRRVAAAPAAQPRQDNAVHPAGEVQGGSLAVCRHTPGHQRVQGRAVRPRQLASGDGAPEPAPHAGGARGGWRLRRAASSGSSREQAVDLRVHDARRVSEDCLYLNVWTPAAAAAERRPVFVTSTAVPTSRAPARCRCTTVRTRLERARCVTFNYGWACWDFWRTPS